MTTPDPRPPFRLGFEATGDREWTVRVIEPPHGTTSQRFALPEDAEDVAAALRRLATEVRLPPTLPPPAHADEELPWVTEVRLAGGARAVGLSLRQAALAGDPERLHDEHLQAPGAAPGLVLELDPDSPDQQDLAALPWELLCEEPDIYLALRLETAVVRCVPGEVPGGPLEVEAPLRVLALVAGGEEAAPDRQHLAAAWGQTGLVEVDVLEEPTAEALAERLEAYRPHVLLLPGQGSLEDGDAWRLSLRRRADGAPLTGRELADLVADAPDLRLVLLGAGETADPALATALAAAGVPAVVALQFPVSGVALLGFVEALLRRVARGEPVLEAVTGARRALGALAAGLPDDSFEWCTPALYSRGPAGRLFDVVPLGLPAEDSSPADLEPFARQYLRVLGATGSTDLVGELFPGAGPAEPPAPSGRRRRTLLAALAAFLLGLLVALAPRSTGCGRSRSRG